MPGHPAFDGTVVCLHRARGSLAVLSGERGLDVLWRSMFAFSQHLRRDLDKELLVLHAEQIETLPTPGTRKRISRASLAKSLSSR